MFNDMKNLILSLEKEIEGVDRVSLIKTLNILDMIKYYAGKIYAAQYAKFEETVPTIGEGVE